MSWTSAIESDRSIRHHANQRWLSFLTFEPLWNWFHGFHINAFPFRYSHQLWHACHEGPFNPFLYNVPNFNFNFTRSSPTLPSSISPCPHHFEIPNMLAQLPAELLSWIGDCLSRADMTCVSRCYRRLFAVFPYRNDSMPSGMIDKLLVLNRQQRDQAHCFMWYIWNLHELDGSNKLRSWDL